MHPTFMLYKSRTQVVFQCIKRMGKQDLATGLAVSFSLSQKMASTPNGSMTPIGLRNDMFYRIDYIVCDCGSKSVSAKKWFETKHKMMTSHRSHHHFFWNYFYFFFQFRLSEVTFWNRSYKNKFWHKNIYICP